MRSRTARRLAAGAIAGVGVIHLALAPEYFSEQAHLGALFLFGGIAAGAIAIKLWGAHHPPSWTLGALVAVGMGIGFVLSRTVGLPGFHESEWEASGILSLLLEGSFLVLAAGYLATTSRDVGDRSAATSA
jgi:uncharacterized membrane protein AbrB (regulator of aidB expression)